MSSGSLVQGALEDEVRPPLPVKRDTLYGDTPLFRFDFVGSYWFCKNLLLVFL